MMDATSESERTSLDLSISSPKQAYYVESPSSVSQQLYDNDKSSSSASLIQVNTPNYTSLTESRLSSSSRISNASRWKGSSRRSNLYWPEKHYTIHEDEVYEDNRGLSVGQCRAILVILGTLFVFSVFCSVLWGASHSFSPIVSVKSFNLYSFYYGEGIDRTGVATNILSFNSSVKVLIHSPAPYFGIHVSSSTFKLTFSNLTLATGQLKSYYQPRKSKHIAYVKLSGVGVPLYGAGPNLADSDKKGRVPVKLEFEIMSRGNLLGKMVMSKHVNHVSCTFFISSYKTSKPIEFSHKTCKFVTKSRGKFEDLSLHHRQPSLGGGQQRRCRPKPLLLFSFLVVSATMLLLQVCVFVLSSCSLPTISPTDVSSQGEPTILGGRSTPNVGSVADLRHSSPLEIRLSVIFRSETLLSPVSHHHFLSSALKLDVLSLNHRHSEVHSSTCQVGVLVDVSPVKYETGINWMWLLLCSSIVDDYVLSSPTFLKHTVDSFRFMFKLKLCSFPSEQLFLHCSSTTDADVLSRYVVAISVLPLRHQLLRRPMTFTSSSLISIGGEQYFFWTILSPIVRQLLRRHGYFIRTVDGDKEGNPWSKPNVLICVGLGPYGPRSFIFYWVLDLISFLVGLLFNLRSKAFMRVYAHELGLSWVLLLNFASVSNIRPSVRESMLSSPLKERVFFPVRVYPAQRFYSHFENLQATFKRILDEFLRVASSWSSSGLCPTTCIEHWDYIEGLTSMFFGELSLSYVLNIVIRVVFYPFILCSNDEMVCGRM